ncbi:hypothetical protein [Kocuria palustris]|uniref:hypothetical protein n=1 Tax=Kocuria palustris TaxID=71999 RepID=UPI0011A05DE8|nr:hypothetical protein [Kocuria palustris]
MPTADSPSTQHAGSAAAADDGREQTTLTYRRAPKAPVFLVLGAVLGLLVGIVAGVLGSGNVSFTTGQVVGYMATIFALLGLALGAIAYVIADRVSVRRAREVQAYAESSPGRADDRSADVGD